MEQPPPFDIIKLDGNKLILGKRNGTWPYDLRTPKDREILTPSKAAYLKEMQVKPGSGAIGAAIMERLGEKGMRLRDVLI